MGEVRLKALSSCVMKDTELITQEGPSEGAVFIGLRAGGPAGWARWREGAGAGGVRRDGGDRRGASECLAKGLGDWTQVDGRLRRCISSCDATEVRKGEEPGSSGRDETGSCTEREAAQIQLRLLAAHPGPIRVRHRHSSPTAQALILPRCSGNLRVSLRPPAYVRRGRAQAGLAALPGYVPRAAPWAESGPDQVFPG